MTLSSGEIKELQAKHYSSFSTSGTTTRHHSNSWGINSDPILHFSCIMFNLEIHSYYRSNWFWMWFHVDFASLFVTAPQSWDFTCRLWWSTLDFLSPALTFFMMFQMSLDSCKLKQNKMKLPIIFPGYSTIQKFLRYVV